MHKQAFAGIADPWTLCFRIDNDACRLFQIRAFIHKHMAVANARLDDLDATLKFDAFGYTVFNKVDAKWDGDNKNATLTLVAKYDYNDTTLQKIIDQIKGNDQNEALDFALNGNYTKAGVVARTIRGQTYVAISLRVGRNL